MKTISENEYTEIIALNELRENGVCYEYMIIPDECHAMNIPKDKPLSLAKIKFQRGSIKENGVNGCQIEDLLAICKHQIECETLVENKWPEYIEASYHIDKALKLINRTSHRQEEKGVE